ncbi:hypothetical protein MXB_1981 [Myxobolus squamalis]|nr:hypothetical protein MXB_1981 [Myxobolus squamalis]
MINPIFSKAMSVEKNDLQNNHLLNLLNFWQKNIPLDSSNEFMIDLCNFQANFNRSNHIPNQVSIPCHEFPAGLMMNQIHLSDCEYDSIDADLIQMPVPQPPSASLLTSVDLFYSVSPNQDGMGWENDGLIQFFARKAPYIRSFKEKQAGKIKK